MSNKMLDAVYGIDRKNGGGLIPNHFAKDPHADTERRRVRQFEETNRRYIAPVLFQTFTPFNFPSSTPIYNLTGMMDLK